MPCPSLGENAVAGWLITELLTPCPCSIFEYTESTVLESGSNSFLC